MSEIRLSLEDAMCQILYEGLYLQIKWVYQCKINYHNNGFLQGVFRTIYIPKSWEKNDKNSQNCTMTNLCYLQERHLGKDSPFAFYACPKI